MKKQLSRLALVAAFTLGVATIPAAGQAAEPGLTDTNAVLQYWQGFGMITVEMEKALEDIDAVRFEGDALDMVRDNNNVLKYLYTGAAQPHCDWGLDFRSGPELLLPHLKLAREMARMAVLRARYRFENGHAREGVDDALATFELAGDVGQTPVIISILVRYAIEQTTIDTLARHLPKIDRATLDYLAKELESQPAPDKLAGVWPQESKFFIDWTIERLDRIEKESAGDKEKWEKGVLALPMFTQVDAEKFRKAGVASPAGMREMMATIKTALAKMVDLTDLPSPAEQDAKIEEVEKPLLANPSLRLLMPNQKKIFQTRRRWQARHAMLDAAVAVARDGEAALKEKKYADPFGEGASLMYRKTDSGFELESKLVFEGKPVTLRVGK